MSARIAEWNVRPAGWREIGEYARKIGYEWHGSDTTLMAINRERARRGLPAFSLVGGKLTAKGMRVS